MSSDPRSPFVSWRNGEPSIFAGDKHFASRESGMTMSQHASLSADKFTARTGRSAGTISGISSHADKQSEEHMARHRAARARRAGQ